MTTKSTTQIATVLGFSEYPDFASSPPKKYMTLTWQGTSEQQLFQPSPPPYLLVDFTTTFQWLQDGAGWRGPGSSEIAFDSVFGVWRISFQGSSGYTRPAAPGGPAGTYSKDFGGPDFPPTVIVTGPTTPPTTQIAGAKFDYSGSSAIDGSGNYTTLYEKNLSAMCTATKSLITCFLGGLQPYVFTGWLGPSGHQKCTPPGIPYDSVGNEAIGKGNSALLDSSAFWGSKAVGGGSLAKVSNFVVNSATGGTCVDSGTDTMLALFEPVPPGTPPGSAFSANVVFAHDYSSVLSDEYTDAMALTNAQVITGNGTTAQNFPRTTGFVSTFTNVVFTLACTNLISGENYTVSLDFSDLAAGVTIPKTYSFTADNTLTKTIIDTVPTPLSGHSTTVRNPKIAFA
jgi:hypothetical protein